MPKNNEILKNSFVFYLGQLSWPFVAQKDNVSTEKAKIWLLCGVAVTDRIKGANSRANSARKLEGREWFLQVVQELKGGKIKRGHEM